MRVLLILALPFALSGCIVGSIASTAVDVATAPVKVAGKAVDLMTTSQSEADEKRGRALRKAEERFARDMRAWEKDCERAMRKGRDCAPRPVFVVPD